MVAEGVELLEASHALADMGCDAAQGYYFARPQPAGELRPYLMALSYPVLERPGDFLS